MGGFLGIGGSGGADKQLESQSRGDLQNVFNYGLGTGQTGQTQGNAKLNDANDYWKSLLSAGRTSTAENASPAINSVTAAADAQRKAQSTFGTGRTGGTAANNQNQDTATSSSIDDIINKNLVGGRAIGAQGEQSVGSTELQNALQLLGIGTSAQGAILNNAQAERGGVRDAQTAAIKQLIGSFI